MCDLSPGRSINTVDIAIFFRVAKTVGQARILNIGGVSKCPSLVYFQLQLRKSYLTNKYP